MQTVDGRTLELVRTAIAESAGKTRTILEYGEPHVVVDHATYRQYVGYLSGLAFIEKAISDSREQAEQEAGSRPAAA